MPGALIRSLTDKYLVGKYSNGSATNVNDKSAMFLIFETTDYNQTYASMLEWEGTMLSDLFILFNIPKPSNSFIGKPWNDIVVSNQDARILYGENGVGIFYYAFVNKNNFVITSSQEALKEVVTRILIKNDKAL
jgi:hypothetical protein